MNELIKKYPDGKEIVFELGTFDSNLVTIYHSKDEKFSPLDKDFVGQFVEYCQQYGIKSFFNSFNRIYDMTDNTINGDVLRLIDEICSKYEYNYSEDWNKINRFLVSFYASMVAEERRIIYGKPTKVGRRMKRAALDLVLFKEFPIEEVSLHFKNRGWRDIVNECESLFELEKVKLGNI